MKRLISGLPVLALLLSALPTAARAATLPPSASVTITDNGESPRTVSVPAGGSVMWTNAGNGVHTATSIPGTVLAFDSGGLGHGQSAISTFGIPGTYSYTSATDCRNGNSAQGFDCGPYTIVVAAAASAAGVAPASAANVSVTVDDAAGFQPANLTVQAGQTVVWTNSGSKVHTVTSDGGYFPGYDSGGLNAGQSFSFTFTSPGIYTYHSSTEPVYFQDPNSGTTNVGYAFKGTITVVTPGGFQPTPTPIPPAAAPVSPGTGLAFASKDVTAPPLVCGNGNRVPCISSAPNNGTQYVQGHVLDRNGAGIGGLNVQLSSSGGGEQTTTSEPDGLFTIVLFPPSTIAASHCPVFPSWLQRTYRAWLTDAAGGLVSDTRSFQYYDCSVAGEFHFDFVKQ